MAFPAPQQSWSWQLRIARANHLARATTGTSQLLTQYGAILTAQRTCYDRLRAERLTGSLERDLTTLQPAAAELFTAISSVVPAQAIQDLPTDVSGLEALLRISWRLADAPFLARVVLQPYAEALRAAAGSNDSAVHRDLETLPGQAVCPFCGGPPQVGVLHTDGGADGGGRALVCAMCSTNWPVRRILCAHCGEEDERRLGYFHAADVDHVRIDACETCRRYLKTVDLTRLGVAVPIVDEVASGALDIWAQARGYTKVTSNLIGL
jgi:FdhE protein